MKREGGRGELHDSSFADAEQFTGWMDGRMVVDREWREGGRERGKKYRIISGKSQGH